MALRTVIETTTKTVDLTPEELKALNELYGIIWVEAVYDPKNDDTQAFARKLLPHIELLNGLWRFQE